VAACTARRAFNEGEGVENRVVTNTRKYPAPRVVLLSGEWKGRDEKWSWRGQGRGSLSMGLEIRASSWDEDHQPPEENQIKDDPVQ